MKYFLSLLAVLALVGAGCATNVDSQTSVETTTDTELVDDAAEAEEAEAGAEGIEIKVVADGTASTTDENGVPVFEVVLGEEADVEVDMEAGNFFFATKEIRVSPGALVNITFTKNSGFHTFVIDEIDLSFTVVEGEKLSFTAPETPGSYPIYCDIGSHRAFGMEGMLIVE